MLLNTYQFHMWINAMYRHLLYLQYQMQSLLVVGDDMNGFKHLNMALMYL